MRVECWHPNADGTRTPVAPKNTVAGDHADVVFDGPLESGEVQRYVRAIDDTLTTFKKRVVQGVKAYAASIEADPAAPASAVDGTSAVYGSNAIPDANVPSKVAEASDAPAE